MILSNKNYGDNYFYHSSIVASARVNSDSNLRIILSPYFNSSTNGDAYIYNIKINNITKKTSLSNLYDYIESGADITNVSPLLYLMSNQLSDYITGFLPTLKNKIIYCSGDSLTAGGNGATNSYVNYLREYFKDCTVYNYGSNGAYPKRIVNQLTDMGRDNTSTFPIRNPDYTNATAVIINIGTNGGVTGTAESSIPQINNATDLQGNPLSNLNVNNVIANGIIYNGNTINTANDYWNLFSDNWYGNVALCIEYIQWKNPYTQIFLLPPCVSSIQSSSSNSAESIYNAMKIIGEIYGVHVIDINNSIGINRRNESLYRVDYVHGTNQRNEMVGKFVANYISNKIY